MRSFFLSIIMLMLFSLKIFCMENNEPRAVTTSGFQIFQINSNRPSYTVRELKEHIIKNPKINFDGNGKLIVIVDERARPDDFEITQNCQNVSIRIMPSGDNE